MLLPIVSAERTLGDLDTAMINGCQQEQANLQIGGIGNSATCITGAEL